jgi:FMN-dependent NADH-azoreductase
MTTILKITTSPRVQSFSRRVAGEVVERLQGLHPDARVIERDLAARPPPHPDPALVAAILSPAEADDPAFAHSEELIGELESADWVVIGTPMNNFTVPSSLKAWIDHVVRIRRTFRSTPQGKIGLLRDRPVFVVVSHGGYLGTGPAAQPDFLAPYLTAILHTVGIDRVEFIRLDGLARGPEAVAAALAGADAWLASRLPLPGAAASPHWRHRTRSL